MKTTRLVLLQEFSYAAIQQKKLFYFFVVHSVVRLSVCERLNALSTLEAALWHKSRH